MEKETNILFIYQVTIQTLKGGGFQYIPNMLTNGNEADIIAFFRMFGNSEGRGLKIIGKIV